MSCHILSFLAFPPAVSVRPLTPRSGYLTSHKSGWATSFCWRQRIRRHGFHQLPPFLETLEIGKFENWEEPLHGLFFGGENDDNPLGLGMFGVSCFQTKPLGYPEAGGCWDGMLIYLLYLTVMPRRTASTQPTPGTSIYWKWRGMYHVIYIYIYI